MIIKTKNNIPHIEELFNKILLLSRNKIFYTKFDLIDTFQNRIHLIFVHFSFIFTKSKKKEKDESYKKYLQDIFDLIFEKIELNMREIGYSDTSINKNMKFLIKTFYNILFECENYAEMSILEKNKFFNNYLEMKNIKNTHNNGIIGYFDKYKTFCFDLSPDSVLKGEINFNYK
jgi:hypothetical protein